MIGLLAGLPAGCNTPSVPLPPPDLFALSVMSDGNLVSLKGAPSPRHVNVRFYVFDLGSGEGAITHAAADGSFASRPFAGAEGDLLDLYYDTPAGERSEDACATLRFNTGLIRVHCR
jgi:hypothetical protein